MEDALGETCVAVSQAIVIWIMTHLNGKYSIKIFSNCTTNRISCSTAVFRIVTQSVHRMHSAWLQMFANEKMDSLSAPRIKQTYSNMCSKKINQNLHHIFKPDC